MYQAEIKQGFHYFVMGWHLITQPGLRRFVIMPILLNILLLSGVFWLFLKQIGGFVDWTMTYIPDWLGWLSYIILALSIITVLLLFYFIFTTLAGFIVAPFNGLLAEKVEKMLTGEPISEGSAVDFLKDIPRMFAREWQKLFYSLPKFIGLFLLSFIPVLGQTVVPIFVFIFSAWMLAIQYSDYPFDNHKIPFAYMKDELGRKRTMNITFGTLISLCTFVPLINFVVIPVAVCGSTVMWVEIYRSRFVSNNNQAGSTAIRPRSSSQDVMVSHQSKEIL